MSNKRTLADLMNNDFFIDFDDTEAKAERKRLAESLIRKPLKESKLKEGFYKDTYDMTKDKISEEDLYKALVTDGELISLNAGDQGKQVSFKDKGRYSDTTYEITEYDGKFSIAEFHNSDDGDWSEGDYYFETDSFESLCAELEKLFPGALVECKMTEEVEEPDNAVVDCKVNKIIAHCEDEKPVDCLGEKKPLEKPLTEEPNKMTAAELKDKYGTDDVDIINAGREEQDRVELKEARSVAEIKAEIAKLQQELADAEAAEKKARITKRPEVVYVWDIYLDPAEKGNWFSAEEDDFTGMWEGTVYETADAAIRAGNLHLDELWDEGDLEYSRRDYYIDAQDIPLGNVSDETLSFSGLDHLIESLKDNELNEGGQTPEAKAWQDKNCYKWNAYAVINGKRKSVACTYAPKEINPDTLIASVRRIAAHKLNLIMSECYFLEKPFAWDGNLEITHTEFGAEPEYITTIQIKRQGDRDLSQIPEL